MFQAPLVHVPSSLGPRSKLLCMFSCYNYHGHKFPARCSVCFMFFYLDSVCCSCLSPVTQHVQTQPRQHHELDRGRRWLLAPSAGKEIAHPDLWRHSTTCPFKSQRVLVVQPLVCSCAQLSNLVDDLQSSLLTVVVVKEVWSVFCSTGLGTVRGRLSKQCCRWGVSADVGQQPSSQRPPGDQVGPPHADLEAGSGTDQTVDASTDKAFSVILTCSTVCVLF